MNDRVYIAGKITGDPNYKEKFKAAAEHLLGCGFQDGNVVNPVEHCSEDWPWLRCMLRCLRLLCGCGWVAMLPDWKESRGAKIEHFVAQLFGKNIFYLNQ